MDSLMGANTSSSSRTLHHPAISHSHSQVPVPVLLTHQLVAGPCPNLNFQRWHFLSRPLSLLPTAGHAAAQLSRYLVHSLCSDITHLVLAYLAEDSGQWIWVIRPLPLQERGRVISQLPEEPWKLLLAFNDMLNRAVSEIITGDIPSKC